MKRGPRIGVALSSGGGRGVYAHTGFLLALEALGVEASAIAGCSAGAVVGGVLASDTDLHGWSRVISASRPGDFWKLDSWPRLLWELSVRRGRGYTGLSGTEGAIEFCRRNLAVQTFEACRIPFYALAMQLSRGEKVLFCRDELAPRIVASAAMPVLYRPVEIDGDLYCDGAVFELTPTEAICCRHELDVLLVHHTAARRDRPEELTRTVEQPWAFVELLNRLLYCHRPWYLSRPGELAFRRCPCGCDVLIVVIEPDLSDLPWPSTRGGAAILEASKRQSHEMLLPHIELMKSDPRRLLARAGIRGGPTS